MSNLEIIGSKKIPRTNKNLPMPLAESKKSVVLFVSHFCVERESTASSSPTGMSSRASVVLCVLNAINIYIEPCWCAFLRVFVLVSFNHGV